jgi:hypothetical protein
VINKLKYICFPVIILLIPLLICSCGSSGSSSGSTSDAAPTDLAYSSNSVIYIQGTVIGMNAPTCKGGKPTAYSINPALPSGLVMDSATGIITGTPTAVSAKKGYTITASNAGGNVSVILSITINSSSSGASDPVINKFEASSNNVLWGSSIQLTANFQNGTGIVTPGSLKITSGNSISIKPTVATTYVLTVTDTYGSSTSKELTVTVYLEGKYTYNLLSTDPIEAYFSFSSTGVGNSFWKRTFPESGVVDGWGGVFKYTIKSSTIDLYWTDGDRSGTHSTISGFGSDYIMFEGDRYKK